MVERPHLEVSLAVGNFLTETATRRERHNFIGWKCPLRQNIEHLAAHVAGGSYDRDLETHPTSPNPTTPEVGVKRVAQCAHVSVK